GSRIEPIRMMTAHGTPARAKAPSRLLVNSVLPTPGNPVMCIGMRACRPMAISWTKWVKSMRLRALDTAEREMEQFVVPFPSLIEPRAQRLPRGLVDEGMPQRL